MMAHQRTIGDLSREADVPISTVRYYERTGLITPDSRTDANYRLYGDGAVERLRFIRTAQASGFTLADIKVLLEMKDGNMTRCKEVKPIVEQRLANVEARIEEFQQFRRMLQSFLDICSSTDEDDACGVMDRLDG